MENYPIEALIRYIKTEIDTIALDYDGVIVNSVVESKKIVIKTAGQYGQLVKMTDFKDYSGMSWEEMFPKLGEKLNWTPELISEISKESTLRALNKKFDVPDFLLVRIQELKDVGLKIGVVTNRTMSSLKTSASLAGINLEEVFDFVATSDNLAHKKPSPGVWDDLYNSTLCYRCSYHDLKFISYTNWDSWVWDISCRKSISINVHFYCITPKSKVNGCFRKS